MSYHGPYDFGWPDELVDIHFPRRGDAFHRSMPWYYYLTRQTPRYFQYISDAAGGHGWQCEEFLPLIRILPIDTQKLVPTGPVGFNSLEDAANEAATRGTKLSQDAFGRINFKNKFFWDVMGLKPPTWANFANGLPTSRVGDGHRRIDLYIEETTINWRDNWQNEAEEFNASTQGVDGDDGTYTAYGHGPFALPVPGFGYETYPLPQLEKTFGKWYFGATNPLILFERGHAAFWKQPWAFNYEIGQLDPDVWDMNQFPPRRTDVGQDDPRRTFTLPTSASGKANGYNPNIAFPLNSPVISGTN